MKLAHLFVVPALALALSGCTVNHHHHYEPVSALPASDEIPGQVVMTERIKGIEYAMRMVARNLANTETIAYKATRTDFSEGQMMPQVRWDWSRGEVIRTDNPLDLYIAGEGLFKVEILDEDGGGIAYTRAGRLAVNRDGELVFGHAKGHRLADGITIPDDAVAISIDAEGLVMCIMPDNSVQQVGQIELHRFISPQGLYTIGGGLYVETTASGEPITELPGEGVMGTLMQYAVEASNAHAVTEMVEMNKLTRWSNALHQQLGLRPLGPPATIDTDKPGLENLQVSTSGNATEAPR